METLYRDNSGERTQPPTSLRLQEARKRGIIPRSHDLTAVVMLLVGAAMLWLVGGHVKDALVDMVAGVLGGGDKGISSVQASAGLLWQGMLPVIAWSVPVWVGVMFAGVLGSLFQVGFAGWTGLKIDFSRVSPGEGIRRMLSSRSLIGAGFTLLKVLTVGVACYMVSDVLLPRAIKTAESPAQTLAGEVGAMVISLGIRIGLVLLVLAVLDYLYRRWQHHRDLRITPRELREDLRRMEGDVQVRRKRRQLALEISSPSLDSSVSQATAVLVASTGETVAIRYTKDMDLPSILARGGGYTGEQIRRAAFDAGIAVIDDDELATALFRIVPNIELTQMLRGERLAKLLAAARGDRPDEPGKTS